MSKWKSLDLDTEWQEIYFKISLHIFVLQQCIFSLNHSCNTHTHTPSHTFIHTHTHHHTHTLTITHTHTHTHIYISWGSFPWKHTIGNNLKQVKNNYYCIVLNFISGDDTHWKDGVHVWRKCQNRLFDIHHITNLLWLCC